MAHASPFSAKLTRVRRNPAGFAALAVLPAALLLLLYELVAEKQGVDPSALRGTVQNRLLYLLALFQVAIDILNLYRCVVDEDADSQRQAPKRHDV